MTRNYADPDFEPRLADWFEADPDLAPAPVLTTVLAAFPSIPQRRASRVPRRFQTMPTFARALVAAAVIVGLVAGGALVLVGGSPPTAPEITRSSSPPPADLTRSFASARYGYRVQYPDGWAVTPASATWMPGTVTPWDDPALDVVQGPTARLITASQPLADGQTPEQWYVAYCQGGGADPSCADYASTWTPITIGGQPGWVDIDGLPAAGGSIHEGAPMYDAVTVVDGRGYEFTLDGDVDRALFERLLAAVTFTAARVSPLDHVSSTFTSPLYGYTFGVDPAWATTAATVAINTPGSTDENCCDLIPVAGTDTTIRVSADPLNGRTIDAYLLDVQHGVLADPSVPGGCKPPDPGTWGRVPVGSHSGVLMSLCNFSAVYVNVGDRVYAFEWGHDTFSGDRHLPLLDFEQLLRTVEFGAPAPSPSASAAP